MKDILRDFFAFSSLERKGILVLILLILVITGISFYFSRMQSNEDQEAQAGYLKEILAFEQQLIRLDDSVHHGLDNIQEDLTLMPESFIFDPNEVSAGDLRRLGINDRVIRTLLNYRNHGGRFYQAEDLKKIYGLSSQDYSRLLPLVKIRETQSDSRIAVSASGNKPINMNLADSSDFESLPGIGPVLARRIIRYRSLLGGYCEIPQLKEVYGITDSLYLLISSRLYADTSLIRKIDLNTASETDIGRHPYIGKYYARGIIRYRTSVGKIRNPGELKSNGLLPPENFDRIKKYLSI